MTLETLRTLYPAHVFNYIFYHNNCMDGFGARFVMERFQRRKATSIAAYVPFNYGDKIEVPACSCVLMVDCSLPRKELEQLRKECIVVILDHHKSAMDDLGDLPLTHFDMEHSGAMLAWKYTFGDLEPPALIRYIEDLDLWRFQLPDSRSIGDAIQSTPMTYDDYSGMLDSTNPVWNSQTRIMASRLKRRGVETMAAKATDLGLALGYKVIGVNATLHFSEVSEELLAKNQSFDVAAYYFDRGDGKRQWGLRSRPGSNVDVSEIAKMMGGGGHKHAAGFTTKRGQEWPQ